MTPDVFSTETVGEPLQYEAWRTRWRPLLDVTVDGPEPRAFPAVNKLWPLGGMAMSRVSAPPVRAVRHSKDLRRDSIDHWVLTWCRHGTTEMTIAGRSLRAPPCLPFVWSLGEPSDSRRSQVERLQLFLTRDAFRDIAPLLDSARGTVLDTPLGRLLGDFMLSLEHRLPNLTLDDLPALTRATAAMVAAAIAPSAGRIASAGSLIDLGSMERVRSCVQKHLYAPELRPAMVSRLVGVSRSALYRLFQHKGGVARYIQEQRLLAAHAALTGPGDQQSIAAIAASLCFTDASAFSRAFRQAFGYSPSDVRNAAWAGMPPSPQMPPRRDRPGVADFSDLLRAL